MLETIICSTWLVPKTVFLSVLLTIAPAFVPEIDLVFAIGSAGRDASQTYQKMKDTVVSIVNKYGIEKVNYGVVTYGNTASVSQGFESVFPNSEALTSFVDSLPRKSGGLALDKALREVRRVFDSSAVFIKPSLPPYNS